MGVSRRNFLSNSIRLAGAGATAKVIPFSVLAQPMVYGPREGLAQLHWNENYYGPSELAIKAIKESSHKGAYYPYSHHRTYLGFSSGLCSEYWRYSYSDR